MIFSVKTTLFDNKYLTTPQHFLISYKLFKLRFPKKSHIFLCLTLFLFLSVLFLRKFFLRLGLCVTVFDKVLFMKGDWFPLTYVFFWEECLFKIVLLEKVMFFKLSSNSFPLASIWAIPLSYLSLLKYF